MFGRWRQPSHKITEKNGTHEQLIVNMQDFACGGKGHLTKIRPNNYNKNENLGAAIVKRITHKRESYGYQRKDTMKSLAYAKESSFAFKMDDYYLRKTTVPMGLLVNAGATSHIARDAKKLKNYDQTFQPENHNIELADGIKTSGGALKRRDAEVCLLDADGNQVAVTLKKSLLIPSYSHDIFSVKVATTNGAAVI